MALPKKATTRKCRICKKEKPFSEFYKHKGFKYGVHTVCKKCSREIKRIDYKNNPKQHRERKLKKQYNITVDEYDKLLKSQNEVCAICGKKEKQKNKYGIRRLVIDHNHKTGKIRGLLCNKCNQGLGYFDSDDGLDLLLKAVEYVRKYNE